MTFHSKTSLRARHSIHDFVFADAALRESGTGYSIVVEDIGKTALQQDDNSYWVLMNIGPLTWDVQGPAIATVSQRGLMSAADKVKLDNTGSGTEFQDSLFRVYDEGDNTKKVAFQASAITTGTTRTIAVPDANITLDDSGDPRTDPDAIHDNVSGEISIVTEKAVPVSGDFLLLEDSVDSNNKKRVQVGNLPGGSGTDPDAIHDNVAGEIDAITEKALPVSGDFLLVEDSADANNKKKIQIGNLPGGGSEFPDDQFRVYDDADNTKKVAIQASAISTGTTRIVTVPDANLTLDDAGDPRDPNAHPLGGAAHTADTLADLNSKVSDANLDDSGDPRDPNSHNSLHENGGADEISVAGLSGVLANPQTAIAHTLGGAIHTADTLANLNTKVSDATLDDSGDPRNPNAHGLGSTSHSVDTLANVNSRISDANLDDSGEPRTDSDAIHDNVSGEILVVAEKVLPVGADVLLIEDSADTNSKKRVQIANLPGGGLSAHALGGSFHTPDTLANLNSKVSDATLDDSGDPRTDNDAIHDNVAGEIDAITEKALPVSGDFLLVEDSADSNNKKKIQIGNLPGGGGSEFSDGAFRVNNTADPTKQIALDASGITTGNVRQISAPDYDFDLEKPVVDSVQLDTGYTPGATPEGLLFWSSADYTLNVSTGLGPILQVGQELYVIVYNGTASQIDNGKAVYPVGGHLGRPSVAPANASVHTTFAGVVLITTMDIPSGQFGIVAQHGKVRDVDTSSWGLGDTLWVSSTVSGDLTNVEPQFPDYSIQVGGVTIQDALNGEIQLQIEGVATDTIINFWNGVFRESFDFTIDSDGAVITGYLAPSNGHDDMTMMFSDGFSMLDTSPAETIVLTPGTDSNPQTNYVYILQSAKVLAVSTAGWPAAEHIKVAEAVLQTAATSQTNGALRNQNWNDHIESTTNFQGHLSHICEKLRQFEAQWNSGAEGSLTIDSGPTPDLVLVKTTAGIVYQMHMQDFPLFDMTQYIIDAVNTGLQQFTISDDGDLSSTFPDGRVISVQGSTGNDGRYKVVSTNFSSPDFVITVEEVIPSAVVDGSIGDEIHVANDSIAPFKTTLDLSTETLDSTGTSLTNRSFSFVVWGVQNKGGEPSHLMLNLPSGSYSRLAPELAVEDGSNYSIYDIPKQFQGVGFLIARFTLTLDAGGNIWTLYDTEDLRGKIPNVTAGGGAGGTGVTTFLGLTDTPSAYTGQALGLARVNSGETALEFHALLHSDLGTVTADQHHTENHSARHTDGSDDIQDATAAQKGLATAAQITKLDGIEPSAEVNTYLHEDLTDVSTDQHHTEDHAARHTNGSDDIQNATAAQKGLATAAQITKLDGIEALAEVNVVDSVFSRTGDVVAATSDYDASQIDNDSGVAGTYVDQALDNLETKIDSIESTYSRRAGVIDYVDCTLVPPTEVLDDRYILDFTAGTVHANWDGAAKGDIVQFNGSTWDNTTPIEGWVCYVDLGDQDRAFVDDGVPDWEPRIVNTQLHADLTDISANQHHLKLHAADHVNGTDDIQNATAAQKGLATAAQITKLDGIEALAEVNTQLHSDLTDVSVNQHHTEDHAARHTNGSDDIQNATAAQKGLATAAQITSLEANTTHRTSNGSDHGYLNQDVTNGSAPVLSGANFTNITDPNALTELADDPSPQLAADLDLDENSIELSNSMTSNLTANGIIISATVDVNAYGIGAALHQQAADFHWETADADSASTMPCMALALASGTGVMNILLYGVIRRDAWTWVAGDIYVSTTTGALTQTAPTGTSDQVQKVGYALSANSMMFAPSPDVVGRASA